MIINENMYYLLTGMCAMLGMLGIMQSWGLFTILFDDPNTLLISSSLMLAYGWAMWYYDDELKEYIGVKNEA